MFVGYSTQYKGYRCLDLSTRRIYITHNAQFDEVSFLFSGQMSTVDLATLVFSDYNDAAPPSFSPAPPPSNAPQVSSCLNLNPRTYSLCNEPQSPPPSTSTSGDSSTIGPLESQPSQIAPSQPFTSLPSTHPMITRAKSGVSKSRHFVDIASLSYHGLH